MKDFSNNTPRTRRFAVKASNYIDLYLGFLNDDTIGLVPLSEKVIIFTESEKKQPIAVYLAALRFMYSIPTERPDLHRLSSYKVVEL